MCFKSHIFSATRTQIYGLFRTSYMRDDPRSPKLFGILCSSAAGALMSAAPGSDRLRALNGIPARCDHVTSHLLPALSVICNVTSNMAGLWIRRVSFPGKCRIPRVEYNNTNSRGFGVTSNGTSNSEVYEVWSATGMLMFFVCLFIVAKRYCPQQKCLKK